MWGEGWSACRLLLFCLLFYDLYFWFGLRFWDLKLIFGCRLCWGDCFSTMRPRLYWCSFDRTCHGSDDELNFDGGTDAAIVKVPLFSWVTPCILLHLQDDVCGKTWGLALFSAVGHSVWLRGHVSFLFETLIWSNCKTWSKYCLQDKCMQEDTHNDALCIRLSLHVLSCRLQSSVYVSSVQLYWVQIQSVYCHCGLL